MRWIVHEGLKYIQFPALADSPRFYHAIYLRHGHPGSGDDGSQNIGLGCGDSDTRVWEKRQRLLALWGNPVGVFARQVHGVGVGTWSASGSQPGENNAVQLDGDALVTDCAGSALVIQTADCQPVILIDPAHRVVANVHSGWRGSIQNIIAHTIGTMVARFGSRPVDLVAAVGPSLGPCCAEFVNYRQEIPEALWSYRRPGNRFNFWQMSTDQLCRAGLQRRHIHLAGICTRCNPHLFFSYRAEQRTGRFASVVGIRRDSE